MRKKLLIAGAVLAVLLVGFLIAVAMQPTEFTIARSATMAAPPAEVFAQVNDFHKWEQWSPWARLDPNSTAEYSGAESGEGAVFRWSGNSDVGEGTMTILESRPHERIRINLEFTRPFADTSTAEFTFQPEGDGTQVTWSMSGTNSFVEKAFCLLMDMDQMVGGQFDKGLNNMREIVEAAPAGAAPPAGEPQATEDDGNAPAPAADDPGSPAGSSDSGSGNTTEPAEAG